MSSAYDKFIKAAKCCKFQMPEICYKLSTPYGMYEITRRCQKIPEDTRSYSSEVAQKLKHRIIPTLISILYDVPCRQAATKHMCSCCGLAGQSGCSIPPCASHMRSHGVHASRCVNPTHVVWAARWVSMKHVLWRHHTESTMSKAVNHSILVHRCRHALSFFWHHSITWVWHSWWCII